MNEIIKNDRSYVGYEYKEILVSKDKVSMCIDGYKNFGWKLDENRKQLTEKEKSIIYLKRDRRIINKAELTRLQRHFAKISDKEASLIEPFTVGCRAARRAFPKNGEKAIVFGAGTIGIAAAIALKYFGCEKVMICDHSDFRLEKAKKLGFEICNNGKENLAKKAIQYFGEALSIKGVTADVDIYIDAAGAECILETYQEMGKIESRMVIVAVLAGMRPVNILDMTFSQHSIIGSGGYMPEDVKDVMNIMESGKWDIDTIITHKFPLEKLSEAIEKAADVDNSLNLVIEY